MSMEYTVTALLLAWVLWRVRLGPAGTVAVVFAVVLLCLVALAPAARDTAARSEGAYLLWVLLIAGTVLAVRLRELLCRVRNPAALKAAVSRRGRKSHTLGQWLSWGLRWAWALVKRHLNRRWNVPVGAPPRRDPQADCSRIVLSGGRRMWRVLVQQRRAWAWWLILAAVLVSSLVRFEFAEDGPVGHVREVNVQPQSAALQARPELLPAREDAVEARCQPVLTGQVFGWQAMRDLFVSYRQELAVVSLPSVPVCVVIAVFAVAGWQRAWRSTRVRRWRSRSQLDGRRGRE